MSRLFLEGFIEDTVLRESLYLRPQDMDEESKKVDFNFLNILIEEYLKESKNWENEKFKKKSFKSLFSILDPFKQDIVRCLIDRSEFNLASLLAGDPLQSIEDENSYTTGLMNLERLSNGLSFENRIPSADFFTSLFNQSFSKCSPELILEGIKFRDQGKLRRARKNFREFFKFQTFLCQKNENRS